MRKSISLLLVASIVLAACGFRDSRINPANWFGRSQSVPTEQTAEAINPLIPQQGGIFQRGRERSKIYAGTPLDQVTSLIVERVPGGAILRVTGQAERQGVYQVQLTPANKEEEPVSGVLSYRLEAVRPARATAVGTAASREVVVARKLTDQQLSGVRSIRVEGLRNARVARR